MPRPNLLGFIGDKLFTTATGLAGTALHAAGPTAAIAAGVGVGTAAAIGGVAMGAGYLGYRAVRGPGRDILKNYGGNEYQLNAHIQTMGILGANGGAAVLGMHSASRRPWVADVANNGNLEVRTPAQLNATGGLVLGLNSKNRGSM